MDEMQAFNYTNGNSNKNNNDDYDEIIIIINIHMCVHNSTQKPKYSNEIISDMLMISWKYPNIISVLVWRGITFRKKCLKSK